MTITRHFEWTPGHAALFTRDLDRLEIFLKSARDYPNQAYRFYTIAQTVFLTGSVPAPDSPQVGRVLKLSTQALAVIFAFARVETPRRFVCLGEGSPVTFSEASDPSYVDVINWQRAYYLSLVTRLEEPLEILKQVPYQNLMHSAIAGGTDEINYQFIDLLKAVATETDFTRHEVFHLLEKLCSSGPVGAAPNKYVKHVTAPMLHVLRNLERKDESQFNRSLDEALQGHKRYWSSSKKLREDLEGLVSLPLTAFAALAHDRGMTVTVEADYMPMPWVTGAVFQKAARKS